MSDAPFTTYVALGDSFTEGVGDPDPTRPNGLRGWADRVAEQLAVGNPDFRYANLAIRGRLLPQIIAEQVDAALALSPDLVTIYAGGNDMMRPGLDVDAMVAEYDLAIGKLVASGAKVLVFTAYDAGWAPVFRRLRGRTAIYNELVREVVERNGATLVDYWRMDGFADTRMWDVDRLHMSPLGHTRMAANVLNLLAVPHVVDAHVLPARPALTAAEQRRENLHWVRIFLLPWLGRRVRGASSGDGVAAKRPEPAPI
ncbi:SGNH/GDSL hydrolase family protein [Speluncibacter jeojiensis]|uniref:SGNH/GDSL hydrolase family protein n=1 Tax=Speluncibacter jeojiensis TaxID=2710754 RepID=A0A9X4RBP0_9ACTN|nr:SGNH/GDSL hydrolase family protein [Corynebacteriales bacterium D3-21]